MTGRRGIEIKADFDVRPSISVPWRNKKRILLLLYTVHAGRQGRSMETADHGDERDTPPVTLRANGGAAARASPPSNASCQAPPPPQRTDPAYMSTAEIRASKSRSNDPRSTPSPSSTCGSGGHPPPFTKTTLMSLTVMAVLTLVYATCPLQPTANVIIYMPPLISLRALKVFFNRDFNGKVIADDWVRRNKTVQYGVFDLPDAAPTDQPPCDAVRLCPNAFLQDLGGCDAARRECVCKRGFIIRGGLCHAISLELVHTNAFIALRKGNKDGVTRPVFPKLISLAFISLCRCYHIFYHPESTNTAEEQPHRAYSMSKRSTSDDSSDIDECATGSHRCPPEATCRNKIGSYECICGYRYYGDDNMCKDLVYPMHGVIAPTRPSHGYRNDELDHSSNDADQNAKLLLEEKKNPLLMRTQRQHGIRST
ncbi:hypothetical protein CAPTEDRAFT_209264 [Capitella teleta]|uniref:EGF-like domain-containing protein n=1 Tax=Capitella teleta TaxID=283909 RepID=R7U7N3_CAPTE|nr:hypothetical protein CAPTEDRAFT_209264 [Capitella teleta]|eukprot:ELU02161.1 hypothetical protein CAPTEDRAFT_209264 [Capitella teleta]